MALLMLDVDAYDVNVSPDKRTILLHDQSALLESIKASALEDAKAVLRTKKFSYTS